MTVPEPDPASTAGTRALDPQTLAVTLGRPARVEGAAVGPPLHLTSTYVGRGPVPTAGVNVYGRPDNETVATFESVVAALESPGVDATALAFASGMAAIAATVNGLPHGALVLAPTSAYNTTLELLADLHADGQIRLSTIDITDTARVVEALTDKRERPQLLWLESPTNPMLGVADLPALLSTASGVGCRTIVDNTFATPLLQRPLELGADVVVHSVTKYLAGHSDVVLGAVVTRDPGELARLTRTRRLHGAIAGPFEAWLALRGLRTLGVRLERQQASAHLLAERAAAHPKVTRVRYPGLTGDPGHARAAAQMAGFGAMLAIELADAATADRVVEAVRLWVPATSLGGVESLIERRRRMANEPVVVPEGLLRLSVGLESAEDLWADLCAALDHA